MQIENSSDGNVQHNKARIYPERDVSRILSSTYVMSLIITIETNNCQFADK